MMGDGVMGENITEQESIISLARPLGSDTLLITILHLVRPDSDKTR